MYLLSLSLSFFLLYFFFFFALLVLLFFFFFFSSRRRHTRFDCDWSSDVCSSDLNLFAPRDTAVQSGGTVTWTWTSGTTQHSVTYLTAPGALPTSSPTQDASGPPFSTTFTTVGHYTYHCTQHPTLMTGSVTVVH